METPVMKYVSNGATDCNPVQVGKAQHQLVPQQLLTCHQEFKGSHDKLSAKWLEDTFVILIDCNVTSDEQF